MAKETIYRCDKPGCKLTRPEVSASNWYTVISHPQFIGEEITRPKALAIEPFDAIRLIQYQFSARIFCGESHALEYISSELKKLHPARDTGSALGEENGAIITPKWWESVQS